MRQILRGLRGLWRNERLLLFIMILCVFSSALLLQFSYGLYQNFHVVLAESADELKDLQISIAEGQTLTVGTMRDYIRQLPQEITEDAEIIVAFVPFGCAADHITRTDAEWEALRQQYALYTDVPDSIWETLAGKSDAERAEALSPYRTKNIQYTDGGTISFRFAYRNGDFVPSEQYHAIMEKNGRMNRADSRFFTAEEYATGAHVAYAYLADDVDMDPNLGAYLRLDENHISLWGESYEVILSSEQAYTPVPPITAAPADARVSNGNAIAILFAHNLTKQCYDTMKEIAETTAPGVMIFPELPFPDNDSMYLYRNIMLISALIAVLSVLNFVLLYQYLLQRRSRSLAIFRITGCTAFRAVRMYLGECFAVSIPVYFAGLGVFILLLRTVFDGLFPYMAQAFSPWVYAAIFAMYLVTMLLMLTVMVTHHVRQNLLDIFYGREAR